MFTTIAFFAAALIGWSVGRLNERERTLDEPALLLQTRQDVKLIVFLLFAILVMLGVIADSIRGGFPALHF
jgi:hypothetical protein